MFFESHINLFTLIARNRSEKPSVERKRLHKRKFETDTFRFFRQVSKSLKRLKACHNFQSIPPFKGGFGCFELLK